MKQIILNEKTSAQHWYDTNGALPVAATLNTKKNLDLLFFINAHSIFFEAVCKLELKAWTLFCSVLTKALSFSHTLQQQEKNLLKNNKNNKHKNDHQCLRRNPKWSQKIHLVRKITQIERENKMGFVVVGAGSEN
jgi:hypothetical protein